MNNKQSYLFSLKLMLFFCLIIIGTSTVFTFFLVNYRVNDVISCADSQLLTAVEFNRILMGSNYHDNIKDQNSISKDQYMSIVDRNDNLCRSLNLQYLWSVLVTENGILFTSATHSDLNDQNSAYADFFEKHKDPDSFSAALASGFKPAFSSFSNEWGKGRMVLFPGKDIHGRIYIFGASVRLDELDEVIHKTIIKTIIISLSIILVSFIIAFILSRLYAKPFLRFISDAERIADGDLDSNISVKGPFELKSLFFSLEKIRFALKQKITDLSESEQKYRLLHQSAGVGIGYYTPDGVVVSYNKKALQHMNGTIEDFIGKSVYDIFPLLDAEVYYDRIKKAAIGEALQVYVDKISLPSGVKWFNSSFTRVVNSSGEVIGIQIISNDISEVKKIQEDNQSLLNEKELLLREVHHRIKNNMNSIKGLIQLHIAAENDEKIISSLKDVDNRVQSMMILYDKLYCRDNPNYREMPLKDYLQPLAEEILSSSTDSNKIRLVTAIDDIVLNFNQLTPIGLIVNEILTNMIKYAFVDKVSGVITISVVFNNKKIVIIVQDDGVGIPESIDFNTSSGFGMQLIGLLVEQIGGKIRLERNAGSKFILDFLLDS